MTSEHTHSSATNPTPTTQVGLRVGRYELLTRLAQGGTATVYIGRAVGVAGFSRLVAIKVLHRHLAEEPEFVDMFLDEARLAAAIHHPHVVATHDIGEHPSLGLYLVMDFVEGSHLGILGKFARENGVPRLPVAATVRILLDVLDGLSHAHDLDDDQGKRLNVVHRDVSPQNILVGVDGIARITDFGIARAETRLTSTRAGSFKGKISYVSPEQALAKDLDARSDLFSLGIVLWETLSGERLASGPSDLETLKKIVQLEAPKISERDPSLEPFDEVLARCLATDPNERFDTAADMAAALEAAAKAAGVGVAARKEIRALVAEHVGPTLGRIKDRATQAMGDLGPLEYTPSGSRSVPSALPPAPVPVGTGESAVVASPRRRAPMIAAALLVAGLGVGGALALQGSSAPESTDAVAEPPAVANDAVVDREEAVEEPVALEAPTPTPLAPVTAEPAEPTTTKGAPEVVPAARPRVWNGRRPARPGSRPGMAATAQPSAPNAPVAPAPAPETDLDPLADNPYR